MGGGAWPFLVGGVICLVNSDNERDSNLLNSTVATLCGSPIWSFCGRLEPYKQVRLLRGTGTLYKVHEGEQ